VRALSISGVLLTAIIFFCSCDDDSQTPETAPLDETTWRLVRFELTGGSIPAAEGQELTLRLAAETGGERIAYAMADCNQCGGPYTLGPDDSISIELACTEMYCGDDSQGGLFAYALNNATSYSHDNTSLQLVFSSDSENGSLIFTMQTE
jgi:heat shock protein HslJ